MLLYQVTRHRAYLRDAELKYAAIRRYYLSPAAPLYTDFVIDNGSTCRAVPGIFLGSVNGNMIWAGAALAADTSRPGYLRQAIATALAVRDHLSDSAGIFNPMFTDIDVGEPPVEAMYYLAASFHQEFARKWLLVNASAAAGDMNAAFEPGRFFDGPPPSAAVTSWAVNGGVALMTAAAAVDGAGGPFGAGLWKHAVWVRHNVSLTGASVLIRFTGRAIAITGTIGDVCCQAGFALVAVDGKPTFSNVGIWQNRSSPARRMNNQILFAWSWRTDGPHSIAIYPGVSNPLQGGAYFHMTGYLVAR